MSSNPRCSPGVVASASPASKGRHIISTAAGPRRDANHARTVAPPSRHRGTRVMALVATVSMTLVGCAGDEGASTATPPTAPRSEPSTTESTTVAVPSTSLEPTTTRAIEGVAGADGVGDDLFPLAGNGGYDVESYELTMSWDPTTSVLGGRTHRRAPTQCRWSTTPAAPLPRGRCAQWSRARSKPSEARSQPRPPA